MAEIKLFVLCVVMVEVCLELHQGQAQDDVYYCQAQYKAMWTSLWLSTYNLSFWGKPGILLSS